MELEHKVCLVCSTPNDSIHFGIEACRACTSFFKRAALSGRNYPCRQGGYCCEITRGDKFTCRRCRYDKCVALGMIYDGPLRRNKETQAFLDLPTTSYVYPLLDRIGREFLISEANRQERELELMHKCADAKRLPHPNRELYLGTTKMVMRTIPMLIEETWTLFRKSFPSLHDLPMQEQMELYRFYLPNHATIDSILRAWKVWGTFFEFSMCSVTLCFDLRSPDSWFEPGEGGINRAALISTMALYVSDQKLLIGPCLNKAQLKDQEINALFAMILCETDIRTHVSDRLLSVLDAIRNEALTELQRFYRDEMKLTDYSARLGNLMTICHAVREWGAHFRQVFLMQVALFDIWTAETQLKELIL